MIYENRDKIPVNLGIRDRGTCKSSEDIETCISNLLMSEIIYFRSDDKLHYYFNWAVVDQFERSVEESLKKNGIGPAELNHLAFSFAKALSLA